jgi:NADH-quinone oxidoreductase subunit C
MLNKIVTMINAKVPGANATVNTVEIGDASISVDGSKIHAIVEAIKTNDEVSFNALQVITAVDFVEYFEVAYIFGNFVPGHNRQFILKVKLTDRNDPKIDTVCDLYPAANFLERECWDMMGITFNKHPDHRRILCPDDWEGFPLRKDYVAAKMYNGMEIYPENKQNIADQEFVHWQKEEVRKEKEVRKEQEAAKANSEGN